MAWTTPLTAVANAALTAAQWNASVRDDLLETAAAKASTAGGYYVTTGANALTERTIAYPFVGATEATTLTSFDDLPAGTVGPAMTTTTSSRAIVMLSAFVANNTVNANSSMGVDVSGAATVGATDAFALRFTSSTANASVICSYVAGLSITAGSSTYTAKYKVSSGTGTFANRRLTVMPF